MSSGASRSTDQVPPYLRQLVVLGVAIAALASAILMLLKGGIFYKIAPPLVIATLIVGGLSRTRLGSPARQRVALVAVVLLVISLAAAVLGSLR